MGIPGTQMMIDLNLFPETKKDPSSKPSNDLTT